MRVGQFAWHIFCLNTFLSVSAFRVRLDECVFRIVLDVAWRHHRLARVQHFDIHHSRSLDDGKNERKIFGRSIVFLFSFPYQSRPSDRVRNHLIEFICFGRGKREPTHSEKQTM